jgi:hypothetical protein
MPCIGSQGDPVMGWKTPSTSSVKTRWVQPLASRLMAMRSGDWNPLAGDSGPFGPAREFGLIRTS